MATILLKKLIIQGYSLDLLTIVSCVTLSCKYQDSSSQSIDYKLIAECCDISNIQHIHVSLSLLNKIIFTSLLSENRMLSFIFLIFFHMMCVLQHLIISFRTYRILTIISNKSLNKLDLFFLSAHFHIKHLVSEIFLHSLFIFT